MNRRIEMERNMKTVHRARDWVRATIECVRNSVMTGLCVNTEKAKCELTIASSYKYPMRTVLG